MHHTSTAPTSRRGVSQSPGDADSHLGIGTFCFLRSVLSVSALLSHGEAQVPLLGLKYGAQVPCSSPEVEKPVSGHGMLHTRTVTITEIINVFLTAQVHIYAVWRRNRIPPP
jgi:hypothetical protein